MIGSRISHYRIDGRLGRGGMGEVYLAHDLALGRPAALKVLPPEFGVDLRLRLLREAEAARRLQHPGIATFFEAGEDGAVAFIAMEYVKGRTLRERLREGALPLAQALAIASELLEALGHAHRAGIVHRDLKPENVMLDSQGSARLLDFGLALQGAGDGFTRTHVVAIDSVVTAPGSVMGSVGYMAPEQLEGKEADERADLFALAAVLYELISGRPAFGGPTPAARIAATLFGEPEPLVGDAAAAWSALVKSLAKPPADRHATAAEFLRDLRRVGEGVTVGALVDSVAVLDFHNRSADPADAWIGAGIAESLGADLGRSEGVRIVPRPRVAAALAQAQGAGDAATGARLGCRWVLSGSYQRMGEALRVVMELTHVPTERVTVVEKVDGRLSEIFAMQDTLAERAAKALDLRDRAAAVVAAPAAPGLGAYESYTRARQHWIRMTKGEFDRAQELLESAVAQDPGYADALAVLAAVHGLRFTFTTDPKELAEAIALARRAIGVAPDHSEAHVWLAYALWRNRDLEGALTAIGRASALDPANHYPHYFKACMLLDKRAPEQALPLYQRAVTMAPGFGFAWVGLANTHLRLGRLDEAEWSFGRAIELETQGFHSTAGAAGYLGECLRRAGRLDEARAQCMAGLDAVERTDHMYRDTLRAICLVVLGRVARDQGDAAAARTAYHQCELHLGGRPRTLGGGHLLCQSVAGRAAVNGDAGTLEEARALFDARTKGDWSWLWLCEDDVTLEALRDAAVRS